MKSDSDLEIPREQPVQYAQFSRYWTALGGTNIPACYTTNRAIFIKARFTISPSIDGSAEIWARSVDTDGSLGDVLRTNIQFVGGVSNPEYVTLTVASNTPLAICKSVDVWDWQAANINGEASLPVSLGTSGPHVVYTILAEPTAPWTNAPGSVRNAWVSALDVVCSASPWAGGAPAVSLASARIAAAIFSSGRFEYETTRGSARYTDSTGLDFSACVDRLTGGIGLGPYVNCTDCAGFMTAFANLIGADLFSSVMGYGFDTNPYGAIGCPSWTPPSWGWGFSYHEVGWSGAATDLDMIFDLCLKQDEAGDPTLPPRSEALPVDILFSDGDEGSPYVYRERLSPPGPLGYDRCVARPSERQRRPIR